MEKISEEDEKILSSFDLSFAELQKISQAMDNENVTVDEISRYAKRCLPLIRACKQKLTDAQEDIKLLVKELEIED